MKKGSRTATPREILPVPDRPYVGPLPYDIKDPTAKFPPLEAIRPPAGAPNVLVVLLDDVGFGATSAFGGPCATTTAERLAAGGLKYTRFHTTALCSPTRAALLTGRNHHSVSMGIITELATSAPGYTSSIPNSAASIAKILQYSAMLYSFNDAAAKDRHEVQYFEMFGNRGIYRRGWTAGTKHRTPWEITRDAHPEKLHELQRLWLIEAARHGRRRIRWRPASTRCGWSSRTTAAGSARAGLPPSSSMGRRSLKGASRRRTR
jgi:hypothetical protein